VHSKRQLVQQLIKKKKYYKLSDSVYFEYHIQVTQLEGNGEISRKSTIKSFENLTIWVWLWPALDVSPQHTS
jgi:hypothetical protein